MVVDNGKGVRGKKVGRGERQRSDAHSFWAPVPGIEVTLG